MSNCPALPDYRGTLFIGADRPGVIAALRHGVTTKIPPVADALDFTQRDINEALNRGFIRRSHQRPWDKAWLFELTPAGRAVVAVQESL